MQHKHARAVNQASQARTGQTLGRVPSTLLIPLAARARGAAMFANLDPHDCHAQAALAATGASVDALLDDWVTVLNVLWRTDLIKKMGLDFFARHPQSRGINLGAGLSSYFQWFDNGRNRWLDADLPEVIALRRRCLRAGHRHCHNKSLNITQPGWWQSLHTPQGKNAAPVLLLCEGVLMYLKPVVVESVLQEIGGNAPAGSELIVDFMSPLWLGQAALHPSVRSTGAEFTWGAHNGQELAAMHPRLQLLAQHSASEAYGPACQLAEICLLPYTGGIPYGLARLGLA